MVSILLAFKAPLGSWDDPLYTIACRWVECQDVGVGFDFFFSFSNNYSFYVSDPCFPWAGDFFPLLLPMPTPYS